MSRRIAVAPRFHSEVLGYGFRGFFAKFLDILVLHIISDSESLPSSV